MDEQAVSLDESRLGQDEPSARTRQRPEEGVVLGFMPFTPADHLWRGDGRPASGDRAAGGEREVSSRMANFNAAHF